MSEFIGSSNDRLVNLCQFAQRLVNGENGKMLIEHYQPFISTVNAVEAMQVFDFLLQHDLPFEKVKSNVGKIINVFFKSLDANEWVKPSDGHFLYYLMQENRKIETLIADIRPYIKDFLKKESTNTDENLRKLRAFINSVKDYELHYVKKENILFPYLERTFTQHRCLQLMWSFHDDFRRSVKVLEGLLHADLPERDAINSELGKLFFVIIPIIFREEQIVYPVALRAISEKDWDNMLEQSREIGWCYGVQPKCKSLQANSMEIEGLINLGTGMLKPGQLVLMLENLPVDITFVDENDEVRYFSGAKHRIFPRSKAIIGRKVQNCHPPESVHIVNQIVNSFRKGEKDHADFWIQMKGQFIHIRYFALRSEKGEYKGTIEVSQNVTEIKSLQGEQRLLNWEK